MDKSSVIKLTLEQRKMILQLMNYSYSIPEEFHKCVADAIKKYATKNYSDEVIRMMVEKPQSIANSGFLIRKDTLSLFRGKFAEWLACIEYNALKNSGSVIMTIINPDDTSKADLLHFIKVGDEFKAVAGPDIKTGGSTYVFEQWKKIVTSRMDIPMVDFDDVLTTEEGLKQLTSKQREKFEELAAKYPKKKPIPSIFGKQDELGLRTDYFKSILGIEGNFKYTPELSILLKKALADIGSEKLIESDWTEFNNKCKEMFSDNRFSSSFLDGSANKTNEEVGKQPTTQKVSSLSIPKYSKKDEKGEGMAIQCKFHLPKPAKGDNKKMAIGSDSDLRKYSKDDDTGMAIRLPDNKKLATGSEETTPNKTNDEPRKSPTEHLVSGYTKENGTKVASYTRGKKQG